MIAQDDSMKQNWERWALPYGAGLTILGVLLAYGMERRSWYSTTDWQFELMSSLFLPTLITGSVVTLGAGIVLAWRTAVKVVAITGFVLVPVAVIMACVVKGNVHDWTLMYVMSCALAIFLGTMFFLVSSVRLLWFKRRL